MLRHRLHLQVPEETYQRLQLWCNGSASRITASQVLNAMLDAFDKYIICPELEVDPTSVATVDKVAEGLRAALEKAPSMIKEEKK